ncbi:MAG: conjugative transfer signal peptidase TraF [Gilliamella sp.]|nr:conjugative transfer signal peptidase TraF [Gilliamella sp.]
MRKIFLFFFGTGVIVILMISMFVVVGLRINITKSIPIGIYIITDKTPAKNDYVIFCPPDTYQFKNARSRGYIDIGFCPDKYGYMMKKLVACNGDTVTISKSGVTVNDTFLPLSAQLSTDLQGNKLPRININKILGPDEVLLMSDVSSTSFDARYFGILDKKQIKHVIRPILIF